MRGDDQVVLLIVLTFITLVLIGSWSPIAVIVLQEFLLPAIASLVGALVGAGYAFRLQSDKEQRAAIEANVVAGNLAVFNIIRKINVLLDIERTIISPVRNSTVPFLEMSPIHKLVEDGIKCDINSLSFLLQCDNPNLLGEIAVEESRFYKTLDAVNYRSRVHADKVQPKIDNAGYGRIMKFTMQQLETDLGTMLFEDIQSATDQVITSVDAGIITLHDVGLKLVVALKKQFPERNIISIPKDVNVAQ